MEWSIWNIWCIIFCSRYSRLFWLYHQKPEAVADNPPIDTYVNETEDKITFKIKTRCYLERLTPETMKLLGNTKNKINRDKDGGKKTHLEITKVLIVLCNIVYNDHQQD